MFNTLEEPIMDVLLTVDQVLEVTGLRRTMLYKLRAVGQFPQPVKLSASGRRVAWRQSSVEKWIESREEAPAHG
jgi:predicted DNA-binding transcriptional regulator AlpA